MESASATFDLYAGCVIDVASGLGRVVVVPDGVEPLGEGFVPVRSPFDEDGGWVITAWNPRSRGGLSQEQNRARNVELRRRLIAAGARVRGCAGAGCRRAVAKRRCGGGVVFLHRSDPQRGARLAERYEQNEMFHLDAVRIVVVGVLVDEQRSAGYSVWARE